MWIPEKAIIRAPTHDDAIRRLSFLAEYGYHWESGDPLLECDKWISYREQIAYELEPHQTVLFCDIDWYHNRIEEYNAGGDIGVDADMWMPEDPALRLCTVDEFFEYCGEEEVDDASIPDPSSILHESLQL